jgi:hypothetical protein
MSASRSARWLLACYPPAWRARYGEELEDLILRAAGDGAIRWNTRLDVLRCAARERGRAALGLRPGAAPDRRAREGVIAVLCAWTAFAIAGAMVAKTSEHWDTALSGNVPLAATIGFDALRIAAIAAAVCVVAGVLLAAPATWRLLRHEGLAAHPRPLVRAALSVAAALGATAGLVAWAQDLTAGQRAGHDLLYAAAFLIWAALCALSLVACTRAASATAWRLPPLGARRQRAQSILAAGAALGMAVMAAGLIIWWVAVALRSPGALVGGGAAGESPWVPALVGAAVLMTGGTVTATAGAWRALSAPAS